MGKKSGPTQEIFQESLFRRTIKELEAKLIKQSKREDKLVQLSVKHDPLIRTGILEAIGSSNDLLDDYHEQTRMCDALQKELDTHVGESQERANKIKLQNSQIGSLEARIRDLEDRLNDMQCSTTQAAAVFRAEQERLSDRTILEVRKIVETALDDHRTDVLEELSEIRDRMDKQKNIIHEDISDILDKIDDVTKETNESIQGSRAETIKSRTEINGTLHDIRESLTHAEDHLSERVDEVRNNVKGVKIVIEKSFVDLSTWNVTEKNHNETNYDELVQLVKDFQEEASQMSGETTDEIVKQSDLLATQFGVLERRDESHIDTIGSNLSRVLVSIAEMSTTLVEEFDTNGALINEMKNELDVKLVQSIKDVITNRNVIGDSINEMKGDVSSFRQIYVDKTDEDRKKALTVRIALKTSIEELNDSVKDGINDLESKIDECKDAVEKKGGTICEELDAAVEDIIKATEEGLEGLKTSTLQLGKTIVGVSTQSKGITAAMQKLPQNHKRIEALLTSLIDTQASILNSTSHQPSQTIQANLIKHVEPNVQYNPSLSADEKEKAEKEKESDGTQKLETNASTIPESIVPDSKTAIVQHENNTLVNKEDGEDENSNGEDENFSMNSGSDSYNSDEDISHDELPECSADKGGKETSIVIDNTQQ